MSDCIFVYGTLSPERAPAAMREAVAAMQFVGSGKMIGDLYDLGEYPGAVCNDRATNLIRGQVYQLPYDQEILEKLDEYEEYDAKNADKSLFVRERRPVELDDGRKLSCWVYLYNRDPKKAQPIPGGDYFTWSAGHATAPRRAL